MQPTKLRANQVARWACVRWSGSSRQLRAAIATPAIRRARKRVTRSQRQPPRASWSGVSPTTNSHTSWNGFVRMIDLLRNSWPRFSGRRQDGESRVHFEMASSFRVDSLELSAAVPLHPPCGRRELRYSIRIVSMHKPSSDPRKVWAIDACYRVYRDSVFWHLGVLPDHATAPKLVALLWIQENREPTMTLSCPAYNGDTTLPARAG